MANKWVINDGQFRMSASVEFHKQICQDNTKTVGGGWWFICREGKLHLYGKSHDFGACTKEQVEAALSVSYLQASIRRSEIYFANCEWLDQALLIEELVYLPSKEKHS